jgi:cleavage and polyadenylation specificity factor subunit 1
MLDEETGAEPRVEYASIVDPYILLVRDDASVFIAKMDNNLELEELEKDDNLLSSKKWITGCLYEDKSGVFLKRPSDKGTKPGETIVMFLLSKAGALHVREIDPQDWQRIMLTFMKVYALSDLTTPIYVAEGLSYLPPILSADYAARRGTSRDSLKEILVADLGDNTSSCPYLIVGFPINTSNF